jgi:hypothetical protein
MALEAQARKGLVEFAWQTPGHKTARDGGFMAFLSKNAHVGEKNEYLLL